MRYEWGYTWLLMGCCGIAMAGESVFKNSTSDISSTGEHNAITLALQRMAPTATIDSVRASGMPGLMEVVVSGEVLYFSTDGKFLLQGRLVDTGKRSDLTAETEKGLRATALKTIGPDKRLSFAAENPKHHVTIFTDVDCSYCRKLHQEIAEYNRAGISVDYLFFPRAGLNSPSFDKAAFIWYADDRQQAMNQSMTTAGLAHSAVKCANPIGETMALGQRIAKAGTPTILSADGSFLGGYQTAQELTARLTAQNAQSVP
ncbi:MAG: DsbC family protein [Pseudomonadota bacterium]|nr:DsbC family protein [Pseudomonadota bacterium]